MTKSTFIKRAVRILGRPLTDAEKASIVQCTCGYEFCKGWRFTPDRAA